MAHAPTILVCDGHKLFADVLATFLRSVGWPVVVIAHDPPHAVAAVTARSVDLCLLDLAFPSEESGAGLTGALLAASPSTKVIVLTSTSDPVVLARAVEQGAVAIVFKDEGVDRLVEVIACIQRNDASRDVRSPLTPVRTYVQQVLAKLGVHARLSVVAPAESVGRAGRRIVPTELPAHTGGKTSRLRHLWR
jgi:DNA-binding NarL/FixJ family response regulator